MPYGKITWLVCEGVLTVDGVTVDGEGRVVDRWPLTGDKLTVDSVTVDGRARAGPLFLTPNR